MNHLRDLLDTLSHSTFSDDGGYAIPAEVLNSWARICRIGGEQAQCFWLGDIARGTDLSMIRELCVMPFQVCWFEFSADGRHGQRIVGFLAIQGAEEFRGFTWTRERDGWRLFSACKGKSIADPELAGMSATDGQTLEVVLPVVAARGFLSALHCSNVRRQEHRPDAKLQKARAKRGKAPLFSYWTLQLAGKSERGEDQGGTHASPRVHLRRGHPRQYAPGKWTWVQAHAVGNKANGIVHKDYSAGPHLLAAAR